MMDIIPYLSDGRETEAVGAVVLHRLRDTHVGVWHDLEDDPEGGAPWLGPGRMLTHDAAREMAARLSGGGGARTLLPACVLCADVDLLVWHRPAQRRPIIFETRNEAFNAKLSGRTVLHPPLLFVGRPRHLAIYALTDDARPSADTPLSRVPYFNTYATGSMCDGNVPLPAAPQATQAVLDGYEAAFYDSAFVHTNLGGEQLVRWQGGHEKFWQDMTQCAQFPTSALVPLRVRGRALTVQDVLETPAQNLLVELAAIEGAVA